MTRSNACAGPSQPSQTQRTRAGSVLIEEEEEEEENNNDMDEEEQEVAMEVDDGEGGSHFSLSAKGLFSDERILIRRLWALKRVHSIIYELAQRKLRNTFGTELAELPSRAGLDQEN